MELLRISKLFVRLLEVWHEKKSENSFHTKFLNIDTIMRSGRAFASFLSQYEKAV
jgi:hypothetical protein